MALTKSFNQFAGDERLFSVVARNGEFFIKLTKQIVAQLKS
jgi:hypothetical protein